ncbi:hypothetical protein OSB04_un000800 [Centaurea solstitialis]|uniref:Reverse transcriptase n=1 Tax=Centaurea solstitialis TaxID=347529 RepID=A0AA38S4D8_9ASTR|nr:hypothetical protein OSB04_un000800 [Centaurea solstitialis]
MISAEVRPLVNLPVSPSGKSIPYGGVMCQHMAHDTYAYDVAMAHQSATCVNELLRARHIDFRIRFNRPNLRFEQAIGTTNVTISHLQYADDAIFFGKWNKVNLKNHIKILECFRILSGLKINLRKSKGSNESEVQEWAREMGCEGGTLPFVYLGLPVGASMCKIKNWNPVFEKVSGGGVFYPGKIAYGQVLLEVSTGCPGGCGDEM